MEDFSNYECAPISQNIGTIQTENINLKKYNHFLLGIIILGIISAAIYLSINKSTDDNQEVS